MKHRYKVITRCSFALLFGKLSNHACASSTIEKNRPKPNEGKGPKRARGQVFTPLWYIRVKDYPLGLIAYVILVPGASNLKPF